MLKHGAILSSSFEKGASAAAGLMLLLAELWAGVAPGVEYGRACGRECDGLTRPIWGRSRVAHLEAPLASIFAGGNETNKTKNHPLSTKEKSPGLVGCREMLCKVGTG